MINIAVTSLWKVSNNLKQTIEYTEDKNKTKYFKDLDSTIKYAMNVKGLPAGALRLPLVEVTDAAKKQIEQAIKDCGL